MKHKTVPSIVPEPIAHLLKHYTYVINSLLIEQGLPAATQGEVCGAILTAVLLEHREEIEQDYAKLPPKLLASSRTADLLAEASRILGDPLGPIGKSNRARPRAVAPSKGRVRVPAQ